MSDGAVELNVSGMSEYADLVVPNGVGREVHINDLIRDVAFQLDSHMATMVMLILTFYVVARIMLPVAVAGYRSVSPHMSETWDWLSARVYSFSETMALGASVYLWYLMILQNRHEFMVWWSCALGGVILLTVMYHIGEKMRERKGKTEGYGERVKTAKEDIRSRFQ